MAELTLEEVRIRRAAGGQRHLALVDHHNREVAAGRMSRAEAEKRENDHHRYLMDLRQREFALAGEAVGHRRIDPVTGRRTDGGTDPGPAGGGGGSAPDVPGVDPGQGDAHRDARALIEATLREWGLEALADRAWSWIVEGLSVNELWLRLRETEEWKDRFQAIGMLREAGGPVWREADVLHYERQWLEMRNAAGLPDGVFDDHRQIAQLIGSRAGLPEMADRVKGFLRVAKQAHPAVRAEFAQMFGAEGDRALATLFMGPKETLPALERKLAVAEVGGAARLSGVGATRSVLEQVADLGFNFQEALPRFAQVARLRSLERELTFEHDTLTQGDLVGASFEFDPGAPDRIRRRVEQRAAPFEGGGQAAVGQKGLGLGAAQ